MTREHVIEIINNFLELAKQYADDADVINNINNSIAYVAEKYKDILGNK